MTISFPSRRGFTLIEVMIVIGIIAMVMTAGVPLMTRAMKKNPLAKVVNDTLEGCKLARDRAILQNKPYDFVIRNPPEKLSEILVEPSRVKDPGVALNTGPAEPALATGAQPAASTAPASMMGDFPRQFGEGVDVKEVFINMIDHMSASEARVRFFPNGTSDEFLITFGYQDKRRTIKVDIITGAAWEVTAQ